MRGGAPLAHGSLVAKNCELPAFSTLDILVGRVRKVVHGRIFQTVLLRLSENEQAMLARLLDKKDSGYFTEFNRLREAPKSATFTHLDEWVERLTWLLSLGNMERLVEGLPATKVTHFAAGARSLHPEQPRGFPLPQHPKLPRCLVS